MAKTPFLTTDNLETTLKDILQIPCINNILISGAPGIGKSEITYQVAKDLGLKVFEVRLYEEGETAVGLPKLNEETTEFSKPWWFKELEQGDYDILFLDDFHLVPAALQSYLYRFLTDRTLHNYSLNKNIKVILAGNFNIDTASACEIQSPIVSRLHILLEYKPNAKSLKPFLFESGRFDPRIASFLMSFPSYIYTEDPPVTEPYPNPRSWEKLSQIVSHNDKLVSLAPGVVGHAAGSRLIEYWRIFAKSLESLLKVDLKTAEPHEKFGTVVALAYHFVSQLNKKVSPNLQNYIENQISADHELAYIFLLVVFNMVQQDQTLKKKFITYVSKSALFKVCLEINHIMQGS